MKIYSHIHRNLMHPHSPSSVFSYGPNKKWIARKIIFNYLKIQRYSLEEYVTSSECHPLLFVSIPL